MNINHYFSKKGEEILKTHNLISKYQKNGNINLLEYSYLKTYLKGNKNIVNIGWFIDILSKIDDNILTEKLIKNIRDIIIINENKIQIDNKYIIKSIENSFKCSIDQRNAIINVIDFIIDYKKSFFGLYGYAGTGKTTVVTELTSYLLKNRYIKSIVFTAPTNKAVNIIKSKFKYHMSDIIKRITKNNFENSMEESLNLLNENKIKIDFITIHRLLNYRNDYDTKGERIFIQKGNSGINNYDLVIIDECSMLPLKMIEFIFNNVKEIRNNIGNNYYKFPKVLFTGDKAQLNAVNENQNILFDYRIVNNRELRNSIKDMNNIVMKKIMRSNVDNIINLCINVRQWLEKEIKYPNPKKYIGNGVSIYKHNKKVPKIESKWFKKYLENFNNNDNGLQVNNIILTWTNKQSEIYNNTVREKIFKNIENIGKYEIGDILILNDFYNIDSKTDNNRFYTSEQIKIVGINVVNKMFGKFTNRIPKSIKKLKNSHLIESKYTSLVNKLNDNTDRYYKIWKLDVIRLLDIQEINDSIYTIDIIHDSDYEKLENDKEISSNMIKIFRNNMINDFSHQQNTIDRYLLRLLWREWNKIFIEPFASVNYGCSITTHKSQSSTYVNAFIDVDDILSNNSDNEAKKCLYTALTRASTTVHLLV